MEIKNWSATVEFLANEGTTPVRQQFAATGAACARDELPSKIAASISKAMMFLGDKSLEHKRILELETKLEAANSKIEIFQEANRAEAEMEAKTPEPANSMPPPVDETIPPRRGPGRPRSNR